ncbi:hypothetical protein [Streptomyces virginiae]|uniref:hypothetical protein n=1 Tax=Streptomyces virginiae TaxID=1961 RepID=UPI00379B16FA
MADSTHPTLLIHLYKKSATTDGNDPASHEVHVNGLPLVESDGGPVVLHELKDAGDGMVEVTLTLVARRIST